MSLFDAPVPLRCGASLPGRLWLAPMTNTQSFSDGTLGADELRWLEARAAGGFPVVSTCAAYVHEQGHAWKGQLGISEDRHLDGLRRLATAVKAHGAFAIVQLHHGGKLAGLSYDAISADAGDGYRAATVEDLAEAVQDFADAARRAEAAGFDGVEIHGANGYLLTQFLAPDDNHRTDDYGLSLEGRARLTLEVVDAVRAAVSPGFAVGIRLSPVDTWTQRGLKLAHGLTVGNWVAERGVDFVHLSLGDASGPPPHEDGMPVVATAFREALPDDVALVVAGGVRDRASVERAFAAGVDVVAVGKAAIVHPDFARLVEDADWSPAPTPWSPELLQEAAVGSKMYAYLRNFSGMVKGGKPGR